MLFKIVSANTLIIYFKQEISQEVLNQVQRTYLSLKKLHGIIDLTPSYCSILVEFDILEHDHSSLQVAIKTQLTQQQNIKRKQAANVIKIPTYYQKNLDLQRVATHNNLSIEEVIELHTQTTYRVYAIGFMLGFAYLGTVHPKIATPRLPTPRKKVPKGSVALADTQTAIYPQNSAGGWNIIGHTNFEEFTKFSIGDKVQFERI
jgi:KipI family sensor histidine kinase inhibitor